MCRLFETILIKDGIPQNIVYHQERFDYSRKHFWNAEPLDLRDFIPVPPEIPTQYRCRIDYDRIIRNVEIRPFVPRPVGSLKIVVSDSIDYAFKFSDRSAIDGLIKSSGEADDILIVKNGLVTDTSFANIVFSDGVKLFTPNSPLHKGTRRSSLLDSGLVTEEEIKPRDIRKFSYWQHVNALNPLDFDRFIDTGRILESGKS